MSFFNRVMSIAGVLQAMIFQQINFILDKKNGMKDKTHKKSESEESEERYQPTHKKQPRYQEEDRKSSENEQSPHQKCKNIQNGSLLIRLKQKYEHEIEGSEYTNAERTRNKIHYAKKKAKGDKVRAASVEHSREKLFIKSAHREEMKSFNLAWIEIFEAQRADQQRKLRKLEILKVRDTQIYKSEVLRRCQSAKPIKEIAELQEIEKTQKLLRKRGKTQQLKKIRAEKSKLRKQCENVHKGMIDRIVYQEERKFEEKQTKRYHSFMHRINETRQDHERRYRREQRRLKQKYKNILKNLEHEQKMEMSCLTLNF